MNVLDIWFECRRLSVTLTVDGERITYRGPDRSVQRMLPVLKQHKPALLASLGDIQGLPVEDGPFMPWGPYMTPERLAEWQRELYGAVCEVAKLEGWPDETFDLIVGAIERQPISTLRPDLAHFRERLERLRRR